MTGVRISPVGRQRVDPVGHRLLELGDQGNGRLLLGAADAPHGGFEDEGDEDPDDHHDDQEFDERKPATSHGSVLNQLRVAGFASQFRQVLMDATTGTLLQRDHPPHGIK